VRRTVSMSDSRPQVVRRVLRAPAADRAAVIVPSWDQAPRLAAANQSAWSANWLPRRAAARREVLAAAQAYTAALTGRCSPLSADGPLIVDGHQPELFHPGVWAKNFALGRLAEHCRGTALHLIVDHDLIQHRGVMVLSGSVNAPRRDWEPFDAPAHPQPWEEARIVDNELYDSFAERIERRQQAWGIFPLVRAAWPLARAARQQTASLVDGLTAARRAIEQDWGVNNLELPVSRLCTTTCFARFVADMIGRAAEVAEHYNRVVREYRLINRVRSLSHPVADLAIEDDWTETPFRIWQAGAAQRDRLFARRRGGQWVLRDQQTEVCAATEERLAAALADLPARGYRLRPRALTLTLFVRLWLADLFVHGLGGAKYDEMTDALAARLFGAPPPPFLTISATLWLPISGRDADPHRLPADIAHLRQRLWRLRHNPQEFLDAVDPLVLEKQQLLREMPASSPADRRRRYLRLRDINAALSARLAPLREAWERELARLQQARAAQHLLCHREFSWVLFPEETLRSFYESTFRL
jgi:hypothetical protein